ncbi:hypothetical protein DEO72_LG5g1173 [Vigna unguiculata]|uniref:Uncharacterized protein n=1 Tax=Vigna unguiculata TaxID=3917 RepID=A0A4D6LVZ9_VIGUN|nr:hypothetical protein DEO72_LG5g1173 [Vigna unguiculata]
MHNECSVATASVLDRLRVWAVEKWFATKPCSTLSSELLEIFDTLLVPNQCGEGSPNLQRLGARSGNNKNGVVVRGARSGNSEVRGVGNCMVISYGEEGGVGEDWELRGARVENCEV